jgi:tetratricopeptide (TPR) repeat protein
MDNVAGRDALLLLLKRTSRDIATSTSHLAQSITFPETLRVWIYPTAPSTSPQEQGYGLHFDDGQHTLWVLFGTTESYVRLSPTSAYVILPAPLQTWSQQQVSLTELYTIFGWSQPVPTPRHHNGLTYAAPQVEMSLFLASALRWRSLGVFGPIEQAHQAVATPAWYEHKDVYYTNIGDEYRRQRNYTLAQSAYERALRYNAYNAAAYFGLGEAHFWLGEWTIAAQMFQASLMYNYPQPAYAYRGLGWSYYNLSQYAEAQTNFAAALSLDETFADALNGLGWINIQNGDCTSAIPYFEQAVQLAPDFADPQQGLDQCKFLEKE